MTTFRKLKNEDDDLRALQGFLENAGSSLNTFRYFSKRDLAVINEQIVTVLLLEKDIPVGYGHLDPENDLVWLGICVSEAAAGQGHGSSMMNYLIDYARQNSIGEIHLKVDTDNAKAISLYGKFGFEVIEQVPNCFYIMRKIILEP